MGHGVQLTFDAADPRALGGFWAAVLGYVEQPPPPGFDSWASWAASEGFAPGELDRYHAIVDPDGRGPRILFQRVPEPKSAKNRLHIDVERSTTEEPEERRRQVDAAVSEIVALGATKVEDFDVREGVWTVMLDPEGNEFCVV